MNTPLPPSAVANTLLELAREKGLGAVSQMKLQKLVFYAHGWHLEMTGQPLIDEQIQAWEYGPVVESLYHDLKQWGSRPIESEITEVSFTNGDLTVSVPTVEDGKLKNFLSQVLDIYGKFSAVQLSNMTHLPDTPWEAVVRKFGGEIKQRSITIPDELIRQYFSDVRQKRKSL